MFKIYHVYACRSSEYGESSYGYYSSKKKADKAQEKGYKDAQKNKCNNEGYKVDGYFEDDWNIDTIEVF